MRNVKTRSIPRCALAPSASPALLAQTVLGLCSSDSAPVQVLQCFPSDRIGAEAAEAAEACRSTDATPNG